LRRPLRAGPQSRKSRRPRTLSGQDMTKHPEADILATISTRKASGEPFALATVVRTVAATAAKAGAKAVISTDGTISAGGIGGRGARAPVPQGPPDAPRPGTVPLRYR